MESHISQKKSEMWGTRPREGTRARPLGLKPIVVSIVYGPTKVVP